MNRLNVREPVFSIGKLKVSRTDLVFLVAFCALTVFFAVRTPYGITVNDETLWQFYNYRIASGDRLFADDWMIGNLTAVFTYLPYRVVCLILGGADGAMLVLRYVYLAVKMAVCAYIYLRFRQKGVWAVLGAALYAGTDLFAVKTTSYYSICLNAVFLAGAILFLIPDPKPLKQVFAGFLFSCAVIVEPPLALVWAAYTLLVFVNSILHKKNKTVFSAYAFVLDAKVWKRLFYGILAALAVFVAVCAFCFTGTDPDRLFSGIVTMIQYITFDTGAGYSTTLLRLIKIVKYAFLYSPVFFLLFFVFFFLGVVLHSLTGKHEKLWFSALSVLYILMSLRLILLPVDANGPLAVNWITLAFVPLDDASGECVCHPLLLWFLSVAAYTFTKQKNRRLFAFQLLAFSVSLLVDLFSNNTFGSLLLIGSVPAVFLLRDYYLEQREARRAAASAEQKKQKGKKEKKQTGKAAFCVLMAALWFTPLLEIWHVAYMGYFHETERCLCASSAPLDTRLEAGAQKGIITTKALAGNYEKSLADADAIRSTGRKKLWVVDYDTLMYLNTGTRVCSPAVHLTADFWGTEEAWWALNPDRRPDIAYVPFFSMSYIEYGDITPEEKLAYLEAHAQIHVVEGAIGYIVTIDRWY